MAALAGSPVLLGIMDASSGRCNAHGGCRMKASTRLLATLLFIGLVAGTARADRSYEISLSSVSKIGNVQFKPGEYRLVVDAPKVRLTHLSSGETVELDAKIQESDTKSEHTSVHTQQVDGVSRISEIRIAGSKTRVSFN
jgi:hypothetical protein